MDSEITEFFEGFSNYYEYIDILGKGQYGYVVSALDKITRQKVAIKIISTPLVTGQRLQQIRQEADILESLDHPNIVQFKTYHETASKIFIVMELVPGGDLKTLIQNRTITDLDASKIMHGILKAVNYLHENEIVHRDLKPENILIADKNDLSKVKLADFGFAAGFNDVIDPSQEKCGTVIFMAPEQLQCDKIYNKKVDIWSCGIILFILCNKGKHPLATNTDNKETYVAKLRDPNWMYPNNFTPLAQNLFDQLTKIHAIERYSAPDALKHPWIDNTLKEIPLTPYMELAKYKNEMQMKNLVITMFLLSALRVKEGKTIAQGYKNRLRYPQPMSPKKAQSPIKAQSPMKVVRVEKVCRTIPPVKTMTLSEIDEIQRMPKRSFSPFHHFKQRKLTRTARPNRRYRSFAVNRRDQSQSFAITRKSFLPRIN